MQGLRGRAVCADVPAAALNRAKESEFPPAMAPRWTLPRSAWAIVALASARATACPRRRRQLVPSAVPKPLFVWGEPPLSALTVAGSGQESGCSGEGLVRASRQIVARRGRDAGEALYNWTAPLRIFIYDPLASGHGCANVATNRRHCDDRPATMAGSTVACDFYAHRLIDLLVRRIRGSSWQFVETSDPTRAQLLLAFCAWLTPASRLHLPFLRPSNAHRHVVLTSKNEFRPLRCDRRTMAPVQLFNVDRPMYCADVRDGLDMSSVPFASVQWLGRPQGEPGRMRPPWRETGRRPVLVSFMGAAHGVASKLRAALAAGCAAAGNATCTYLDPGRESAAALFALKRRSVFCLEPPGDLWYRKSITDSLLAGCIPVLWAQRTAMTMGVHLPRVTPSVLLLGGGRIVPDRRNSELPRGTPRPKTVGDVFRYLHYLSTTKAVPRLQHAIAAEGHLLHYAWDERTARAAHPHNAPEDAAAVLLGHAAAVAEHMEDGPCRRLPEAGTHPAQGTPPRGPQPEGDKFLGPSPL